MQDRSVWTGLRPGLSRGHRNKAPLSKMLKALLHAFGWLVSGLILGCAQQPPYREIPFERLRAHDVLTATEIAAQAQTAVEPDLFYLTYHTWHTSLLIPARWFRDQSPQLAPLAEGLLWVRIGFGDGDYFTGVRKSTWHATLALFASRYAALQWLDYAESPFGDVTADERVALKATNIPALIAFITETIAFNDSQQPRQLYNPDTDSGLFFLAKPDYSLAYTCNSWTAQALRAAGISLPAKHYVRRRSVMRDGAKQAIPDPNR
jgi:hypothetical protein